eukprot:SAG11_NODE_2749_length_3011_cov_1168.966003_2_plen_54_part_00
MNTDDLIIIWHLKRLQYEKDKLIPLCLHILRFPILLSLLKARRNKINKYIITI